MGLGPVFSNFVPEPSVLWVCVPTDTRTIPSYPHRLYTAMQAIPMGTGQQNNGRAPIDTAMCMISIDMDTIPSYPHTETLYSCEMHRYVRPVIDA